MTILSKNIRFLRIERGLTLADFEKHGIKQGTMSNYELGKTEPKLETVLFFSKLFGVSIDNLVTVDLETLGDDERKKLQENVSPKLSAQNVSPKQENVSPKRKPKNFGTVSDKGGESAPPENVFSGLTQEEVNEELRAGIREHLLDMFESGRAYPAAIVRQYQDQVKDLTVQLTRLEYENAKLLAELAAVKGKTGVSEVAKTDEDVPAVK